jgi:hypothetical protein
MTFQLYTTILRPPTSGQPHILHDRSIPTQLGWPSQLLAAVEVALLMPPVRSVGVAVLSAKLQHRNYLIE